MSGETLNYYYLGHLVFAWPLEAARPRARTRATCSLGRADGADGDRRLHVRGHAVGGGARDAGERAPRGGPVVAGLVAAALVTILGNLAGVRDVAARRRPAEATTHWFDPSRVIPDTINEFPSFSFMLGDLHAHVLALPFTRARARLRAAGRAARAARRPAVARGGRGAGGRAWRSARCTRSTRGRIRSPPGCWPPSVVVWIRGRATAGAATPLVWLGAGAGRRASC